MSGIFISYRRNDTSGYSRLLYERIAAEFGTDEVFMDVETLREPGMDFVDAINEGISRCSVLLCLIGRGWLKRDGDGHRRIDNSNDFVRLEVASALKRNIRVIPVVVEGAAIPGADELPDDLKLLARRQALDLSHEDWEYDVGKLVDALSRIEGLTRTAKDRATDAAPERPPPPAPKASGSSWRTGVISAFAVIGLLALIGLFIEEEPDDDNTGPNPPPDTPINVAGTWYDNAGEPVLIEQAGSSVRVGVFDPMTQGFTQIGSGTVSGQQLSIRYSYPDLGISGAVVATLAPDQQHMNGTDTLDGTGLSTPNTWHREHLPSH